MADFENGTRFSDLPSSLAIDILLRLPMKTLLICRYVRKDWTRLYFSDPYFIRRQLATSNIQFLYSNLIKERKLRFGCIVDEVSTGNLRLETLELSCKLVHHPKYEWHVVNSCNGLLFLVDKPERPYDTDPCSTVYVCNPILGEWVSIQVPECFYGSGCALGFSAKNNQYKILSHSRYETGKEYEWQIYTLGTGHWRSIETKETIEPWDHRGLDFNTFMHGSLHWIRRMDDVVQTFNFETERFTVFSLPKVESSYIKHCMSEALGVINGCLWASFHSYWEPRSDAEMWAMKEYGDEKSWTMMLALRSRITYMTEGDLSNEELRARYKELVIYEDALNHHQLLFTLNGGEMLIYNDDYEYNRHGVVCYNITRGNRRRRVPEVEDIGSVAAYNPSFVPLQGRGEEVIRGRDTYDEGWIKKRLKKETKEKLKKNKKKKLKKMTNKKVKRVWF